MEELRRLMGAGKINPSRRAAEIVLREIKGANTSSAAPDTSAVGTSVSSAPATPPSANPGTTPHKTAIPDTPTAPQKNTAPDTGGIIR